MPNLSVSDQNVLRSPGRSGLDLEAWWERVDTIMRGSGLLGLYGQFVKPGDLVFDAGASLGTRVAMFRALGAKVIAIEPLAVFGDEFVAALFHKFGKDPDVTIVPLALADTGGRMEMRIPKYLPDMASLNRVWMEETVHKGYYNEGAIIRRTVDCTTLDACCQWYGHPNFIKVDVEGHENPVARGLSWAPPGFNLEYHVDWIPLVAMRHFDDVADQHGYRYEYNYVLNTQAAWQLPQWVTSHELGLWLAAHLTAEGNGSWGDLYGRRIAK